MTLNELVARLMSSPNWQNGAAKETTVLFYDKHHGTTPVEVQEIEFSGDDLGPTVTLIGEFGVFTTNN